MANKEIYEVRYIGPEVYKKQCGNCKWMAYVPFYRDYHCTHNPLPRGLELSVYVDLEGVCDYWWKS